MPDEDTFTLRQVDLARGDLYAIADDLEFLKIQLAGIPTRKELARTALSIIFCAAGLVILSFEIYGRRLRSAPLPGGVHAGGEVRSPGPPLTLGAAEAAGVRPIVW
jgi:hypothetical protein